MPDPGVSPFGSDPYETGLYRWWHLGGPSSELLEAEADGWLGPPGDVVDLGCGLGSELRYLAGRGWRCLGIDMSAAAVGRAARSGRHSTVRFCRADVTALPLRSGSVDVLLDRGCFHYLGARGRSLYAAGAARVLRDRGRLLLRACLTSAGVRNEMDEPLIRRVFDDWTISSLREVTLASDTREMQALEVRLRRS